MSSIGTKIAKGAIWMVLFKFTERSLGIVSTIILARLLIPEDFGLIAMAMSIIAILELFSAFGFDMALIQKQDADSNDYNTAWTFNLILALVITTLMVILASPAALFYEEPRLENVIYILAIGTLISGFENIGVVAFRKELEFNKEFKFLLGKKLIAFCVTVPLAIILRNYWALVFGIIAGKVGSVLLSYYIHKYRPRFDLSSRNELFHFSKWLLINNFLYFFRLRSADFIIGKLAGSHTLGIYTVAFEIATLPTNELIAPINRAVYPGYSKISDNLKSLQTVFLNVISIITLFAVPAGIGIVATADLLVVVFLGTKWLEAIPLMKIIAFYGIFTALITNTSYVYLAVGKARITTLLSTIYIILLLPCLMWLTLEYGVEGAAWAYFIASAISLPFYFAKIFYHLKLQFFTFVKFVWRPMVSSAIMYLVVKLFINETHVSDDIINKIVILFSAVAIGALTYTTILILLWFFSSRPSGAELAILEKIYPRLPEVLKFKFLNPDR